MRTTVGAEDLDELDRLVAATGVAPVYLMPEGTDAERILDSMRHLAGARLALTTRLHILLWGDERGR